MVTPEQQRLYVALSPNLLNCYPIHNSIVVIIDILRASSTMVMALHNGAKWIVPVDSVENCIEEGKKLHAITAGERDGKIIENLSYGNSPLEYTRDIIENKILVITTTNGTKLLHQAHQNNALEIVIGAFLNISALSDYLTQANKNVIIACAGWKDKVNVEDTLFAGALVQKLQGHFTIDCDSALIAQTMYEYAQTHDDFLPQLSHYKRLSNFGLKRDIEFCFQQDLSTCVPIFDGEKLLLWA